MKSFRSNQANELHSDCTYAAYQKRLRIPIFPSTERGSALLAILILATILAFITLSIFNTSEFLLQSVSQEIHSHLAKSKAKTEALKLLLNSASTSSKNSNLSCLTASASVAQTQIEREVCQLTNLAPQSLLSQPLLSGASLSTISLFPRFNYDKLFSEFMPCSGATSKTDFQAIKKLNLSKASVFIGEACSDALLSFSSRDSKNNYSRWLSQYDLIFTKSLSLSQNSQQAPYLLATPGYLRIEKSLNISQSSLILAGGDIFIGEVVASPSVALSIVSASGRIEIPSIKGKPLLRAFAFNQVNISGSYTVESATANAWLPEVEQSHPLGFSVE